jgi:hypothetical protein
MRGEAGALAVSSTQENPGRIGRGVKILVLLGLIADTSISGIRVARELDRLLIERGKPRTIVRPIGI